MRKLFASASLIAAISLLAGCAPVAETETTATETEVATESAFPVTIEHAFGETVIESEPERVVAMGWGAADAAIALGVIPVAIPAQFYGGDENGVLPWIQEAVDGLGVEVPEVIADVDGIPNYEAIAAAMPDVIIAPYSGLDQEQYDTLTAIAPVVAYPGVAWSTPWRDIITITGKALGKEAQALAILDEISAEVAAAADANPAFAGKTIAEVWPGDGIFYVYREADARVEFATDLGFEVDPTVEALAPADAPTFYYTLALESLGDLDSDVLLIYGTTDEEIEAFIASPEGQLMDQVVEGRYAKLVGPSLIASVGPPTALSLSWGLESFVSALAGAIK